MSPNPAIKTPPAPSRVAKNANVVSAGEQSMRFVASTETPDRNGDIVRQNWNLDAFRANPIFQYGHPIGATNHGGTDGQLPIGTIDPVGVENGRLMITAHALEKGLDEFADKVWALIGRKVLRAVSIGFRPLSYQRRYDEDDRFLGFEFTENELLEVSVVNVPANSEALAVAKSLNFSKSDCDRLFCNPAQAGVSARSEAEALAHRVKMMRLRASRETAPTR